MPLFLIPYNTVYTYIYDIINRDGLCHDINQGTTDNTAAYSNSNNIMNNNLTSHQLNNYAQLLWRRLVSLLAESLLLFIAEGS